MGLGYFGVEDVGRGKRGRGDAGTRKRWDSGTCDLRTRGPDKQTIPDFRAEFVKYNFRCSRERYLTFFSS